MLVYILAYKKGKRKMGKFKELFTKAQERRMDETGCSFEQAAEWVEQQTVGFIIDYTDVWKKVDNDEKEKPWPQVGDKYYYIATPSKFQMIPCIYDHTYENDTVDKNLQLMNNFFRTEEDAKFEYERLRILHELKELSDDDQPWNGIAEHWHIMHNCLGANPYILQNSQFRSMNVIYFKSYESAENAVKTIGKDKIKKYLFGFSVNE